MFIYIVVSESKPEGRPGLLTAYHAIDWSDAKQEYSRIRADPETVWCQCHTYKTNGDDPYDLASCKHVSVTERFNRNDVEHEFKKLKVFHAQDLEQYVGKPEPLDPS